jgi:hypothetical protein
MFKGLTPISSSISLKAACLEVSLLSIYHKDMKNSLSTIHCSVQVAIGANQRMLNETIIYQNLTNDLIEYLKQYGIETEKQQIGMKGAGSGGFWTDLIRTIKQLWKDRFIIIAVYNSVKVIIKSTYRKIFVKNYSNKKPRLFLSMEIISKDKSEYDPIWQYTNTLINFKNIADSAIKHLSSKHPLFLFDESLSITLTPNNYIQHYYITNNQLNSFNNSRILNIMRKNKIADNTLYRFTINKLSIIKRIKYSAEISESGVRAFRNKGLTKYFFW